MFLNRITGEFYIGSTTGLTGRLTRHIYNSKTSHVALYVALRHYGLSNFDFMILEYCEADILTCRALEQLYLDLYKPAYNTLPIAGTSLGYKHTAATKEHLSAIHTGPLHPQFGTVSSVSKRSGISLSLSQYFKLNPHHNLGKTGLNAPQYGINGKSVYCYGSNGEDLFFKSINQAKIRLKVRNNTVGDNIDRAPIVIRDITWELRSTKKS